MSRSIKVRAVQKRKNNRTISSSGFAIIRSVPDTIYQNLMNSKYMNFNEKYKLESFDGLIEIPELIDLLEYTKRDMSVPIPDGAKIKIYMGIYSRTASTHIDPPSALCGMRILFNLGYAETYEMQSIYNFNGKITNSGLEDKAQRMEANTYCMMGPLTMSDYKIYVDHDPMVPVPQINPTEAPRPGVPRPTNYKRISIVIDFIMDSEEVVDKLTDMMNANIPKIKTSPGMSKKEIDKQIENAKKQMSMKKSGTPPPPLPTADIKPQKKDELDNLMESIINT